MSKASKLWQAHFELLRVRENDSRNYYRAVDEEDPEVQAFHAKQCAKARRRRMAHFPNPGRSETIMRNRVLRGFPHDGLYNSKVNRG